MKKLFLNIAFVFIMIVLVSQSCFAAYKFPNALWPKEDSYRKALESKDPARIIETGLASIDSIKNEPDNESTCNLRASHYERICIAYEALGMYNEAAQLLPTAIKYAEMLDWKDVTYVQKAKLFQYTPVLDLYTPTPNMLIDFGARNEPDMGVLHGANAESEVISHSNMSIFYINFGEDVMFPLLKTYLPNAQREAKAVEIALNVGKEGSGLYEVLQSAYYIEQLCSIINQSQDLPIYLRFGAEMNVWTDRPDPALFIEAFRFVSNIVRANCPNVAMVWSVNAASGYMEDMNAYYPGDEYVDWVGVSAYACKYFLGQPQTDSEQRHLSDTLFYAGDGANLEIAISEVIAKYGSRKPIMIAEGGVGHTVRSLGNEDQTAWALTELRRAYCYIPMLFPQVKLMAYFDVIRPYEANDFSLIQNQAVKQEYNRLTKLPHFVQGNCFGNGTMSYTKAGNTLSCNADTVLMPVYTYVHTYGTSEPVIEYYLDGELYSVQYQIPYNIDINVASLSAGSHNLRVVASSGGKILAEKQYSIEKSAQSQPLNIILNNVALNDAKAPFIYMSKTLVPVRIVSEKMKYTVDWDGTQRKVTISNKDTVIELFIESYTAYVNGVSVYLEAPAKLIGGTTFVPIRFISEATNSVVGWDGTTKTVIITNDYIE